MQMLGNKVLPQIGGNGYAMDGISSNVAYSVRRLYASYTGSLVRLRRDSDDAESDFTYNGTGALDTAAISSWLSGANGYLVTWYDQSGNGYDATQPILGMQPLYVASSFGSKPAFRWDANNDNLSAGSSPDQADAFTIAAVAATHNSGTYPMIACYSNSNVNGWNLGWDQGTSYRPYLILKTTTGGWGSDHFAEFGSNPTTDQGYRILAYRDAGTSAIRSNGSEVTDTGTTTPMSYGASPSFIVGNRNDFGVAADRDIAELLYFSSALGSTSMNTIDSSQSSYFGV